MRILVWGINYAPELTGIAPYNTALCEFLHRRGHDVEMVSSFSYYPEWRKRAGDQGRWFRRDVLKGVPVYRCWHFVPQRPSTFKRILHELSFVATSFWRILALKRPDVFVVVSPPLLLGAAAWLAGGLKRAPFVFHVQDLQPDAATSLGMVKRGLMLRALYALESLAYRKAARVSGIIPGMLRAFESKGVPRAKTLLFPNGVELPAPESLPVPGRFRARLNLPAEAVLAVYSGNLGVKQGVEILLEAARRTHNERLWFVVCGDGARRAMLEQQAQALGLSRFVWLPLQPEREYGEMMVDADIYLITQQAGSGALFFPSKLLKGLAFAKPVLAVADAKSELTMAAMEGGFARVVETRQPERLAAALDDLAADPAERAKLGAAGRSFVERFEMGRLLESFEENLLNVAGANVAGPRRISTAPPAKPVRPEPVP